MTAQDQLVVSHLSAVRGRKTVLEDISFTLGGGDVLQILGANGSGKSTLLRILAGLSRPDAGQITWNGNKIDGDGRDDYLNACLYIGHKIGVAGDQSARENLKLFQRLNAQRKDRAADQALRLMGYNASPEALTQKTSAGQRQRVALAKLLAVKATLWLLDEPFTALDKDGKLLLENFISEHCSAGGSVVVATHQTLDLSHQLTNLELA